MADALVDSGQRRMRKALVFETPRRIVEGQLSVRMLTPASNGANFSVDLLRAGWECGPMVFEHEAWRERLGASEPAMATN